MNATPVPSDRRLPRAGLIVCALALLLGTAPPGPLHADARFAALIERLSEPEGYFDTDNLISNENWYLQVVEGLQQSGVQGGAYIGVGPDQNFSYIAHIRPALAFIIDIRRDNLLLHLLFKALFTLARNRAEYVSLLFARAPPTRVSDWHAASLPDLVEYIDQTPASPETVQSVRARLDAEIRGYGVALSAADFRTIDRFHRTFIDAGLSLKFHSAGRPARWTYPTYRELWLATDQRGRRWNYLASEADFQFVRSLETRHLVIPVVGDLSGPHALPAVGQVLEERGERLSAFYTSNVEFYLFQRGRFSRFVENITRLPRTTNSVIIRAVFGSIAALPDMLPGAHGASQLQPIDQLVTEFSRGSYQGYRDLLTPRRRESDSHGPVQRRPR